MVNSIKFKATAPTACKLGFVVQNATQETPYGSLPIAAYPVVLLADGNGKQVWAGRQGKTPACMAASDLAVSGATNYALASAYTNGGISESPYTVDNNYQGHKLEWDIKESANGAMC